MSIKAVFQVQCNGPCNGWLSEDGEVAGAYGSLTVRVIGQWPGERAARTAAVSAGWRCTPGFSGPVLCPKCAANPLGIQLPPDRGQVADLIRAQSGSLPLSTPCACGHVLNWHTEIGLCTAGMNTTVGCDCLGFKVQEGWGDQ